MRNFRKIAIRILVVAVFVVLCENSIRFCYEKWDLRARVVDKERTELKGELDTLYVGTSLVYQAYMPKIIDEKLGTSSYNLSTSGQTLMASYYLIREAAAENPIKHVYLILSIHSLKDKLDDARYLADSDYFRTPFWKLQYLLDTGSDEVMTSVLLYSSRVESYTDKEQVVANVRNKLGLTQDTARLYGRRGYVGSQDVFEDNDPDKKYGGVNFWSSKEGASQITEESAKYIKKIGDFCREEGIELTFVLLPVSQSYFKKAGDMENLNIVLTELAQENNAGFYNFMLYKDVAKKFTNEKFSDFKHMNTAGAKIFSKLFAEIELSEHPQDYFYDSVEELNGGNKG